MYIDGLRVRRCGILNFSVVQRFVDEIVTLPDTDIFDAMLWTMERCKTVIEGAAAAPVAAMLHGLIKMPKGSKVVGVLSGVSFAFLVMLLRKQKDSSAVESIILGNLLAFLVGLPAIVSAPALPATGWLGLLALGAPARRPR